MAAKRQRTTADAFLTYRADSVWSLVHQVKTNPVVAKRYAKFFNTTPEAVAQYFNENLNFVVLNRPLHATTYYIAKDGRVKQGKRLLPKGSRVFATKNGDPVLEWRCGNPLTTALPLPPKPLSVKTAPGAKSLSQAVAGAQGDANSDIQTEVATAIETPQVEVASAEPVEAGQLTAPVTQVLPTVETLPVVEGFPAVAAAAAPPLVPIVEPAIEAATAVPATTSVPAVIAAGGGGFSWFLPFLIGGGALLGGGGGDDGPPKPPEPPPAVPEPSSVAVLMTGMATAGFMWRTRKR